MATLPSSGVKPSKKILELTPVQTSPDVSIRDLAIPTQIGNENFYILISELIAEIKKQDLDLGRVDNTSDLEKALSTATIEALKLKAAVNHTHQITDVVGLAVRLAEFFAKNEQIPIENLTVVTELLLQKASVNHTHAIGDVANLQNTLDQKAAIGHIHNLSEMTGYNDLIDMITDGFRVRPTTTQIQQMIADAIPKNIVLEFPGAEW